MSIATRFPTYNELVQKLERDLDLEGEVFVTAEELLGYFNEAVDRAEAIVHPIYEDYFLDHDTITLVNGTDEYSLPSRIYAHKIRRIIYRNGSRAYPVHRLKDWKKFEQYTMGLVDGGGDGCEYCFFITNQSAGAPRILFAPPVKEAGTYITVWFLRQANRFVTGTDILDIPEAMNYIIRDVKTQCYEKEGHPNLAKSMSDLAKEQTLLEGVLTAMVPDAENEIEMDLSFYDELS